MRVVLKHHGTRGLVLKLKALQVLLMQAVAGGDRTTGRKLGGGAISVTRGGLPRVIPVAHRDAIRKGSTVHIQFWLTLFGLYRVLDITPVWKLGTITQAGVRPSVLQETIGRQDIFAFWSGLVDLAGPRGLPSFRWT